MLLCTSSTLRRHATSRFSAATGRHELAAEEARNKRHRDAEAKRRDDKEKAAIAKKERMKREMMASIDNAIIRKREEQETLMKKNREIGIKMNKIAAAKLKLQDEEVKKRLRNKKIYRRDLIRQISEDNASNKNGG